MMMRINPGSGYPSVALQPALPHTAGPETEDCRSTSNALNTHTRTSRQTLSPTCGGAGVADCAAGTREDAAAAAAAAAAAMVDILSEASLGLILAGPSGSKSGGGCLLPTWRGSAYTAVHKNVLMASAPQKLLLQGYRVMKIVGSACA
eukprot:765017-Pelagomonas_calceolata.AAC.8